MFRILGGPISIFIAFADALPLHYLTLFSFAEIPCETSRIFGGPMSTSIAFAHDLSPICLTIFSFSNIPCGTSGILGGPISISIAFAHALIQLYLVLLSYCRFVSLCTRNPGFRSSNPRSARALRLSHFRPSFRIVLADVCGADLSVVRRRSARCLLKLCSRLRQTQNRTVYLLFCDLNLISIAAALKSDSCRLFA